MTIYNIRYIFGGGTIVKIDSDMRASSLQSIEKVNYSNEVNKSEEKNLNKHEDIFKKNNESGSEKLSEKTIKEAIENTNKKLVATDRKFEFSVNEETNDIIVKVINKETDKVIREIPSEKILDMVAKMMELAGLFVDERR